VFLVILGSLTQGYLENDLSAVEKRFISAVLGGILSKILELHFVRSCLLDTFAVLIFEGL
jgi:hypothetical protein